ETSRLAEGGTPDDTGAGQEPQDPGPRKVLVRFQRAVEQLVVDRVRAFPASDEDGRSDQSQTRMRVEGVGGRLQRVPGPPRVVVAEGDVGRGGVVDTEVARRAPGVAFVSD